MSKAVPSWSSLESPLGPVVVAAGPEGVVSVRLGCAAPPPEVGPWPRNDGALDEVVAQLGEYFAGERARFTVPLDPAGTAFQRRVWKALGEVPPGSTTTYGALAAAVGSPAAARAVGLAMARNPIPVLVPCHRVVGADGSLTGFLGGLHRKRWLLTHEGVAVAGAQLAFM